MVPLAVKAFISAGGFGYGFPAEHEFLHTLTCVGEGDRRRASDVHLGLKGRSEGVNPSTLISNSLFLARP